MRVLLINTFYYPKFTGGAEISVQLLAEGLVKAGHEVYVLATGADNKVYHVNNVTVISCKQRNVFSTYFNTVTNNALKSVWHLVDSANPFYYFKVMAILKKISPDIVHTNNIQGFSPLLWYIIKKQKIKLIHTIRDYYLLCHKANMFCEGHNCEKLCSACKITHTVKSKFASYPDSYVGISNYILQKHLEYIPITKQRVIYNSANVDTVAETINDNKIITFGYLGRITPDKGVEYLADELATLGSKLNSGFKIIFAGKGNPGFIDILKSKLGNINYEFAGVVKPSEFYKTIDVLIIPALWNEPFGRTVIESLAHSVPVCQSDRGGLKEIFDPKSSWMFPPEKGVLTQVLLRMLRNRGEIADKRRKCAERAAHFSTDNYVTRYLKLYDELLSAPSYKASEMPVLYV